MLEELVSAPGGRDDDALYEGFIASPPDDDDLVEVVIPAYDETLRFGPCPYMPRGGAKPERGDRCLVAFAEGRDPWVVAWEGPTTPLATADDLAAVEDRVESLEARTVMPIIDFQRMAGENSNYVSITDGDPVRRSPSANLELTYTPPVDCWWECKLHVGLMQQTAAGNGLVYLGLRVSPADEDGLTLGYARHTEAQGYDWRAVERTWKLKAGVTYTVGGLWTLTNGTWQYHQGSQFLWLEAKAFAR